MPSSKVAWIPGAMALFALGVWSACKVSPGSKDDAGEKNSVDPSAKLSPDEEESEQEPSDQDSSTDPSPEESSSESESTEEDSPKEEPEGSPEPEPKPNKEIQIVISVDWEGMSLRESNLAAMEAFRADFPKIPLTQFLNAAYFTKSRANAKQINRKIRRTLKEHDEIGLHIHGWRSLFEASGVKFRSDPLFWSPLGKDGKHDAGHNVDIGSYSTAQLRKVIAFSVKTLQTQGYGRPTSFRSGGWMSRSSVIDALIAEGFERDSSAVATQHFLDDRWVNENLYRWLNKELWGHIKLDSQPYVMKSDSGSGSILQIPDNGGLADYVRGREMVPVYEACRDYMRKHPTKPVTMNFGFHQETARSYLPRLRDGLARIEAMAKKDGVTLVYRTTESMVVAK